MKSRIDLHLHSVFSDGKCTPEELAVLCQKAEIRLAALADHDSVSGVKRFKEAAGKLGMSAISGIEMSCVADGTEIHILGYCVDEDNAELNALTDELKRERELRVPKMIEKLRALGMYVEEEDIRSRIIEGGSVGRPHIADELVRKGYVRDRAEAFAKYIGDDGPAYAEKRLIPFAEAIELIHKSGGFAVWAHPGLKFGTKGETLLKRLIAAGLDGVEAYYAKHSPEEAAYYAALAARYGLFTTCGSDFHKPENDTRHGGIGERQGVC